MSAAAKRFRLDDSCPTCSRDMRLAVTCSSTPISIGDERRARIPFGSERRQRSANLCPRCRVIRGGYHHMGCPIEELPKTSSRFAGPRRWAKDRRLDFLPAPPHSPADVQRAWMGYGTTELAVDVAALRRVSADEEQLRSFAWTLVGHEGPYSTREARQILDELESAVMARPRFSITTRGIMHDASASIDNWPAVEAWRRSADGQRRAWLERRMRALAAEGATHPEIAVRVGLSEMSVRRALAKSVQPDAEMNGNRPSLSVKSRAA